MDKAKDEAINKLIAGQGRMEKDISGIKVEMSGMKEDISELKAGQKKLETDLSVVKSDVSELKQGQQNLETMMLKMIEELTFVKKVVINIENDLKPQVKTLFDADQSRQYETSELKLTCREQEEKLSDHELRIARLEKDKKTT